MRNDDKGQSVGRCRMLYYLASLPIPLLQGDEKKDQYIRGSDSKTSTANVKSLAHSSSMYV